jgi:hypothetical protein
LRREEIMLQVALITPLFQVKGGAAPETMAAVERARLLIEQAEALGEPPEDPLLLFSVLQFLWVEKMVAFNGDVVRELAVQFLTLAEKQTATAPLMIGHRLMGLSLLHTGDIVEGRVHLDRAMALYDPAEHRHLGARFGQDVGVAILDFRSWALWSLGYPEAALRDADDALKNAREIGQAATLMHALAITATPYILCVVVEGPRNAEPGFGIGPDRQSLGRRAQDHCRYRRNSHNGSNTLGVGADVLVIFGDRPCGPRPIR